MVARRIFLCISVTFCHMSFGDDINISFLDSLEVSGRIHIDGDNFNGVFREQSNTSVSKLELRRARLAFDFGFSDNWSSKVQIAVNENNKSIVIKDMFVEYKGWDFAEIKIGKSKEPFGLERLTSSKNTLFIERSITSNIFSLGRSQGLNLTANGDNHTWSGGIYKVEKGPKILSDGGLAVTQRFTYNPFMIENGFSHLGVSFSYRQLEGSDYELKSNGGVSTSYNLLNTPLIATDSLKQWGGELAIGFDTLSFQTEYQIQDIKALDRALDLEFESFYSQISYFLTRDKRRYRDGKFVSVKPTSSSGAVEVSARYAMVKNNATWDFDEIQDISQATIGLNFYINKDFKLMLNLLDIEADYTNSKESGKAASIRLQFLL